MAVLLRGVGFLACLGAGVLAMLAAWVGMIAESDPETALSVAPSAAARYASIERTRADPKVAPAVVADEARELLALSPLSDAPFALVGLEAVRAGNPDVADRAFRQAFARNPRNTPARIWLAQRAIDAGRLEDAVALIDRLVAIDHTRGAEYIEALVQVGALPGGVDAIAGKLGAGSAPGWGAQVVSRLNQSLPDILALARLNQLAPRAQSQFVERIRTERGPEAAFQAWLNLLPEQDVENFHWPYDQRFENKPAPPPFNWTARTDQVEFMRGGGLAVTYMGRGRVRLIDQQMLLAPGAWRLVSVLTGDASANGGGLSWSVTCIESSQVLGVIVLRDLFGKSVTETLDFRVPEDACTSQRISLNGIPGEFPTRARAEIRSVSISRPQAMIE